MMWEKEDLLNSKKALDWGDEDLEVETDLLKIQVDAKPDLARVLFGSVYLNR
jgi:hypothetical protein